MNPAGKSLRRHRFVVSQLYCRLLTRWVNCQPPISPVMPFGFR